MRNKQLDRKPKIGVIGLKGFPAYGGSARAGENMMAFLRDDFHFVVFNTTTHTSRKTGVYDEIEQVVFKKFFIKSLNTIYYYLLSTFYCLFKGGFDVIHVYHVDAAFIVPLLRLRYRVVSGHRARPQLAAKWNSVVRQYFVFMEWLFFKMPADVVTSVSKPIVGLFQNRTRRKIFFIPNGIVFKNNPKPYDIKEKDYILFASGRVISSKGAHVMLQSLNQLNYQGRVLIIGNRDHSPGYSEKLEQLAESLNVRFIDIIKNKDLLMAYLRNSRMFVFPSFHEGMSNMLLEAVSAQVPVICSDIPENEQVFDEGEVFFFKTGEPDDLAKKINYALENREIAEAVARRGYERLRKDYDWETLAQRYADIYNWLIEHKKPLNRNNDAFQGK
ncbi:glycosyltransferase family 4 protein [Marinilabilia rubra]|uniref:Glycosyl transferase family 1 n=1 Tax=Marinilabilia rubra TaxID=2162893 RepID=A0A2U2B7E2_9BACT|nr:glycosyltransferase family 4 protein [Marinilabilia rubra]PWD98990.1 glycosyl transferase family 1 [Marinilabilia rubra]